MSKLKLKAQLLAQQKLLLNPHLIMLEIRPIRLKLQEALRLEFRAVRTPLLPQLLLLAIPLNLTLKSPRSLKSGKTILSRGLLLLVRI